jgi:hypothetical protein
VVAIEFQRAVARQLVSPQTRPAVSQLEQRASDTLMLLAREAESLYLREVRRRSNPAALNLRETQRD